MNAELMEKMRLAKEAKGPSVRTAITHTIRTNLGNPLTIDNYSRTLAIKLFCTECMGHANPKHCASIQCPLFPFKKICRKSIEGEKAEMEGEEDEADET